MKNFINLKRKGVGKMKKILIVFIYLCFLVQPVFAMEYTYTDDTANIEFDIDESIWMPVELNEDREYISNKWESDFGVLMYGATDFYGSLTSSEKNGLSRKEFNSSLIDNSFAEEYISGFESTYQIDDWLIQDYNLKFIDFYGTANYYGQDVGFDIFSTLNNGYLIMFQYYGNGNSEYIDEVENVVKSTISTMKITNSPLNNNESESSDNFMGQLILGLVITALCYMLFPIIRIIVNKGKFKEEKAKKIALWNSIIIGGIFMIITIDNGGQWQAGPAFLYYFINKAILTEKRAEECLTSAIKKIYK